MPGELLIAAGPGEWRAALLDNGIPVELFVERGDRSEAGSIHLGRVRRLLPALGAALVDIGEDRPAFLPESEVRPRGRRLVEGEDVIVQIRREAQGGKAARVTTGVTLRGSHVELRVGRSGVLGAEILPFDEQAQLADALSLTRGLGRREGWGLRLHEPAPVGVLISETTGLIRCWRDILDQAARLAPPARLEPPSSFARALGGALRAEPGLVHTDDPATIPSLRAAFRTASVQHRPESEWPIDLDEVFDQALSESVALVGGGAIHIETTRAGVLIDVDSGTPDTGSPERMGLTVNLAAAEAIARQIRLRNLGGGIVVDFIGLKDRRMRERVRDALAEALLADPLSPQILGWTRLGHLELVRPRRGRPLAEALLEPSPGGSLVKTALTVAHDALRELGRGARTRPGRRWRLTVAPEVVVAFGGAAHDAVQAAEQRFAREIVIKTDSTLARARFEIGPV